MLPVASGRRGGPARTRGRSFFERQAGAVQEGPDRADGCRDAGLAPQPLLHLGDGDVWLGLDQAQQVVAVRIELRAPRLTLLAGASLTFASPAHPHDRGRDPNPEPM